MSAVGGEKSIGVGSLALALLAILTLANAAHPRGFPVFIDAYYMGPP